MTDPEIIRKAQERRIETYRKRPATAQGIGRTSVQLTSGLQCRIEQGGWTMIADQPEAMGGECKGPDPGLFGRAALGACLAQGYATAFAQRGIDHRGIEVQVECKYDARGSLGIAESVPPGYQEVHCLVTIESDADESCVRAALDAVDRTSPWRYNFTTALEVSRQVTIKSTE